MKSAFLASLVLVATTAGAALAGEPMVLTNAQLDRVTAGQAIIILALPSATGKELTVQFHAEGVAGENDNFLSGFTFDPGIGGYFKIVPEGGFDGVSP